MTLRSSVKTAISRVGLPESRGFYITVSLLLAVAGTVLAFVFWDRLSDGESPSTTIRNIGFVIAGLVALPLAVWRGVVADKQSTAAQRQAETALEQTAIAQRSLLNERYQQGAHMLGDAVLSVRLGGIYALERLAAEHPEEYHVRIMKLLCAFVRHPTGDEDYEKKLAERRANPKTFYLHREDVEAAMEVIGSRSEAQVWIERTQNQDFRLNLIGADLSHAQIGEANLSGAMLHAADLSHTNIFSVDLSNAILDGTDMRRARLVDIEFTGARASSADLSGAMVDQNGKPLFGLDHANLSGAELLHVDLAGKIVQGTSLVDVRIGASDLSDARFLRSNLSRASIGKSKLCGASILSTEMTGAELHDTDLSGTNFDGTAGNAVTGLTQAQLDEACADPDNPPRLDGVVDADTGNPLVWRGKACEEETG